MRALKAAATTALAALLVSAAPVAAAPATRVLTIEAPRSGYVDVRISRPLVFDLDNATLRGGRKYTGVVLDRIGTDARPVELLNVRFGDFAASGWREPSLGLDQTDQHLPKGVYRLYALSDAAVRISIPVAGLSRDVRVTALHRVVPRYRMADVPQKLDPGTGSPYGGLRRLAFTSGPTDLAVARFGAVFAPGVVTSDGWDFCVSRAKEQCEQPPGLDWYAVSWLNSGSKIDIVTYAPHVWLAPGAYDYVAKCRGLGKPVRCRAAILDRYISRARSTGAIRL